MYKFFQIVTLKEKGKMQTQVFKTQKSGIQVLGGGHLTKGSSLNHVDDKGGIPKNDPR